MVLPGFYVEKGTGPLKLTGYVTYVFLFLIFCSHSVYLYVIEDLKWLSDTLSVTNIIYYANYPPGITTLPDVGVNYFTHLALLFFKLTPILYILATIWYFRGSKSKKRYGFFILLCIIGLVDFFRLGTLFVFFINCSNYAFCRSTTPPYSTTESNTTFLIMLITSLITFVLEVAVGISVAQYNRNIANLVVAEEKSGMKRNGSKLLEYLPIPNFYFTADEIVINVVIIDIISVILILVHWFKLWYKDRFVWTNDVVVPLSIPWYSILPSWLLSSFYIKFGDLTQIWFYIIDIVTLIVIILPSLVIASCRRLSTLVKMTSLLGLCIILLFFDIVIKTFILFLCRSVTICRTQYAPYLESSTSLFYLIYYYTSVIIFVLACINFLLSLSFKFDMEGLHADETHETGRQIVA